MRPLLFLVLFAACGKNSAPLEPTTVDADTEVDTEATFQLPSSELESLIASAGPDEVLGCQEDADCVVSCTRDGSCCDQLCQCTNVYNRDFLVKLEAQRAGSCERAICPVASCMPPTEEVVARCVANQCVAETKPLMAPPQQ